MQLDFHSHYPMNNSIVCTAQPESFESKALLCCQGLLPNFWTEEKQTMLYENLSTNPKLHMGEIGLDAR
ncbi:MAG: hypothetical protein HUK23_07195, partial [Sphaerochaetaceae bacterium]|nr:hypothetical protein [Sphaerochaetaceae bacterium]